MGYRRKSVAHFSFPAMKGVFPHTFPPTPSRFFASHEAAAKKVARSDTLRKKAEENVSITRQLFVLIFAVLFAGGVIGQTSKSSSWSQGETSDKQGLYAATSNDSEAVFGQYCYPEEGESGTCYWLLANEVNCEKGSRYPVLVNSDAGAYSFEVLCFRQDEGRGRFAFTNFDEMDQIVRGGGRIAVAFPMASGLFQVNRFSLDGASRAVSAMRNRAERAQKEKKTSTKDRFL